MTPSLIKEVNMGNRKLFYCYSKKLSHFLMAFIPYVTIGINKNTNTKYYTFLKSKRLDNLINHYNSIKHKL